MNRYRIPAKIIAVFALVAAILGIYWRWVRPRHLRWGATDEEAARAMPGDELNARPAFRATRAITIEAKPDAIWPWLVQMGYGRAGFYGYDILENLGSPRGLRSADQIVPELQGLTVGDEIPLSAAGGLALHAIVPNEYLVWAGGPGWGGITWALYPADEERTRLVSRVQFTHGWRNPAQLLFDLFTEFADYLAVRKILQGVKDRVEGRREPMAKANGEFAVYLGHCSYFSGHLLRSWSAHLPCADGSPPSQPEPVGFLPGMHRHRIGVEPLWNCWCFGDLCVGPAAKTQVNTDWLSPLSCASRG
jgi:hypothetical protein